MILLIWQQLINSGQPWTVTYISNIGRFYCMIISLFSVFFLLYLFFLVAFNSQTLYIEVKNRMASAFALFISALIYAAIFAYLYWARYVNIDRKLDLRRWLEEKKRERKQVHELRQFTRQSQMLRESQAMRDQDSRR